MVVEKKNNSKRKIDIIGTIILFLTLGLTLVWYLQEQASVYIIFYPIIVITVLGLYIKRTLAISLESRNPLGDTLIVLSGLSTALFFLSDYILIFSSLTPVISLILFASGSIVKLLLLDWVLLDLIYKIYFHLTEI